ncbi:hydroxymethylglutaryl-CoA lyase [Tomitella fengzijianii]|uniref:Hydroxymethylglutaryl-CoA lyase n=1 Tax=Tomitella fengzijianii TaxID=2597660 RepID=A0A516X5V4_9ACTN|nr:hydroxymethylglutaryl-CoA lyase [Tomitella fengzijianii]QDQ98403.1 hydroxymethylglutaryl-CoA lyase [Tomitella fengzijianii]
MGALPRRVRIREVGLRDGLQNEAPVATDAKVRLLEALVATGVPRIELTAFVSPRAVPAMADAAGMAAAARAFGDDGPEFSALVASPGGARRAVDAGVTAVEYVVSAADGHSLANVKATTGEALERTAEVARIVHDAGGRLEVIIATAWDCPFDGPTDPERTLRVAAGALQRGADSLAVADTIGTATPGRVTTLIDRIRAELAPQAGRERGAPAAQDLTLGAHFHNTRGAGLACAWAAVQAGVTELDAAIGGFGGCPFAPGASGNIATEELVYLLADSGVGTGIDLDAALAAAALAEEIVGKPGASNLLRAGDRKRASPITGAAT